MFRECRKEERKDREVRIRVGTTVRIMEDILLNNY
jgi:hypothetical protein